LGSYVNGSPATLIDASEASNPYYFDIQLDEFDPVIFNNNIPFALCGDPELVVNKTIFDGPNLQANGETSIIYRLRVENISTLPAENVQISDALAAIYGAGNYSLNGVTLESAPAGLAATINSGFDGDTNTDLLTAGGRLDAGEVVTILVDINVNVAAGNYTNQMIVNATNPVSGNPIDPLSAQIGVNISSSIDQKLKVSKVTGLVDVKLGQRVPYTITINNSQSFGRNDVEIIDQMPAGFTYIPGSAKIDGVLSEPVISGRELIWSSVDIAANSTMVLQLSLRVGAAVNGLGIIELSPSITRSAMVSSPVVSVAES